MWRRVQGFGPDEIGKEVIELEEESEQRTGNSEQTSSEGTGNLPLPMGEGRGEGCLQDSGLSTQDSPQAPVPSPPSSEEVERLRGELAEVRARALESHRRALLAENAGRVVPELVMGSTMEEMEASLETAMRAFETVRAAALAEIASAPVPAGNPIRQGPVFDGMSPIEKIAYGLKRE